VWLSKLKHDPIPNLLESNDEAIVYFVKRDLLEEVGPPINTIWSLIEPKRILRKQQPNGSWKSPSGKKQKHPAVNHDLTETWKQIRFLIEKYEINNSHSSLATACDYIFKCQTEEGDIRGMLGNQYAAYYTGALISLLIKACYEDDPRVEKGIQWLISVRQNDGGWLANSLMALDLPWKETIRLTSQIVQPIPYQNFDKPSSHNWTGMVIRAFAAHSIHRHSFEAKQAGKLLKKKFFQEDSHYSSYKDAGYWVKFQYPFWWNSLIASLDSISLIGFTKEDPDVTKALNWIIENQQKDGLWKLSYSPKHIVKDSPKTTEMKLWISLTICRILKRLYF
jgi:hypothetical protein